MKKLLLILSAILIIGFVSCKKEKGPQPNQPFQYSQEQLDSIHTYDSIQNYVPPTPADSNHIMTIGFFDENGNSTNKEYYINGILKQAWNLSPDTLSFSCRTGDVIKVMGHSYKTGYTILNSYLWISFVVDNNSNTQLNPAWTS